jgi:hypothetical protein
MRLVRLLHTDRSRLLQSWHVQFAIALAARIKGRHRPLLELLLNSPLQQRQTIFEEILVCSLPSHFFQPFENLYFILVEVYLHSSHYLLRATMPLLVPL